MNKNLRKMIFHLILSFVLLVGVANTKANILLQDQRIENLIQSVQALPIEQRIEKISEALLGQPSVALPFGEGSEGEFDSQPIYRTDAFDCQSFIELVLATALAKDLESFKHFIIDIRYANGKVDFASRNHFPSTDWIPNNIKNGYVIDATEAIAGIENLLSTKTYIDKKTWYQYLTVDRIKLKKIGSQAKKQKLIQLKKLSDSAVNQWVSFNYLPLNRLFIQGKPNLALFNKMPSAAIVMIVRPNWPMQNKAGTHMDISHMGFVIKKNNEIYYRAASSRDLPQVIDVLLINYLKTYLLSPTVRGIVVFKPTFPLMRKVGTAPT